MYRVNSEEVRERSGDILIEMASLGYPYHCASRSTSCCFCAASAAFAPHRRRRAPLRARPSAAGAPPAPAAAAAARRRSPRETRWRTAPTAEGDPKSSREKPCAVRCVLIPHDLGNSFACVLHARHRHRRRQLLQRSQHQRSRRLPRQRRAAMPAIRFLPRSLSSSSRSARVRSPTCRASSLFRRFSPSSPLWLCSEAAPAAASTRRSAPSSTHKLVCFYPRLILNKTRRQYLICVRKRRFAKSKSLM